MFKAINRERQAIGPSIQAPTGNFDRTCLPDYHFTLTAVVQSKNAGSATGAQALRNVLLLPRICEIIDFYDNFQVGSSSQAHDEILIRIDQAARLT